MVTTLPLQFTTQTYPGSQWLTVFQFLNSDGSLMDISAYTYEMVVRTSTENTGTPALLVSSTAPSGSGSITISTVTSSITVILTPTATATLAPAESYALAVWQDPGLTDATAVVAGTLYVSPVAAPA